MSVQINGTNGLTFNDGSSQQTAASGFGFKNRIINGAMMIDQRNAGAAVTADGSFPVDRFRANISAGAGLSLQRTSSVIPDGFPYALGITVTSTKTPLSTDQFDLTHKIEGINVADLGWGTAAAQTVTLSFKARASVTGTYCFAAMNDANNRCYVGTFTINAANTYEDKAITIPGDTTGTWVKDTTASGLTLRLDLGSGSNRNTTAGSWQAGAYTRTSGAVTLVSNASATLYITGVQLEKGSTATSFDYRPYGTELVLCQRYLPCFDASNGFLTVAPVGSAYAASTTIAKLIYAYKTTTRVPPTGISVTSPSNFTFGSPIGSSATSPAFQYASTDAGTIDFTVSGVTAGYGGYIFANASTCKILFNGCEL